MILNGVIWWGQHHENYRWNRVINLARRAFNIGGRIPERDDLFQSIAATPLVFGGMYWYEGESSVVHISR